jgi:hypothetical protein
VTFVEKTLDEMLEEIEFIDFGIYDIIIPQSRTHVDIDSPLAITNKYREDLIEHTHQYIPNLIVRDVNKTKKEDPISVHIPEADLTYFAVGKMLVGLTFAMENAYTRGNNYPRYEERTNEGYLPFTVKSFCGNKGIVFRVRDSGEGFDYEGAIAMIPQRNDRLHGMKLLKEAIAEISYEGEGNIVNIMIKEIGGAQ